MSLKKIITCPALVAALMLGAAIPASAQRKQAARKTPGAQTAPVAAPAKKNARAADAASAQPAERLAPGGEANAPVKKNAAEQPSGQLTAQASPEVGAAKMLRDETRYFYEFAQPDFVVRHVRIEHDAAGRGSITFERKNEDAPLTEPLEISPTAFARIVSAWEALKFLDSAASYQSDKQFANMGTVRLRMKRGERERTAEFNWTHDENAAALMREYRRLTEQRLFVFDIEVARLYQPTETVRVLKRLDILLARDEVSDLSQLAALLRDLSTDERIPLIARNQAARLLKRADKQGKSSP